MRFHDIEVSGIECIVFNRKDRWILHDVNPIFGELWQRVASPVDPNEQERQPTKTHAEMMKVVNALKKDRRYRMWVHFDTLNIVRKEGITPKGCGCMKCQHLECLVCIPPR